MKEGWLQSPGIGVVDEMQNIAGQQPAAAMAQAVAGHENNFLPQGHQGPQQREKNAGAR